MSSIIDHTQISPNSRVVIIPREPECVTPKLFDDFPEVLTAQQTAGALSVCDKQVRELAIQGKIRGFKVGKLWRFTRQALIDFVIEGGTNEQK